MRNGFARNRMLVLVPLRSMIVITKIIDIFHIIILHRAVTIVREEIRLYGSTRAMQKLGQSRQVGGGEMRIFQFENNVLIQHS